MIETRDRSRSGPHVLAKRRAAALLAGTALLVLPAAARAQNADWTGASSTTANWSDPANWTAGVPTATATFPNTPNTVAVVDVASSIETIVFTGDAPAYLINVMAGFDITGAGVVNNSSAVQTFDVFGGGLIVFQNASSAGDATYNLFTGALTFDHGSTAGSATIVNSSSSTLSFTGASSAGSATITNDGSLLQFYGTATAGAATITNTNYGTMLFAASTTAGTATITNTQYSGLQFGDTSTAGNATITNSQWGQLAFTGDATAGSATITNQAIGFTSFGLGYGTETTSAGSARIVNDGGTTLFWSHTTAGNATIVNNSGGETVFNAWSTAGSATIVTNSGGRTDFYDFATGGLAAFVTNGTGVVDFGGTTGPDGNGRVTAGSIAGSGRYYIGGGNTLVVGGNDQSTTVTGRIADYSACGCGTPGPGSLEKVGTGTLTLAGINTYTGSTLVTGGTLIVNGSIASSSGLVVADGAAIGGTGALPSATIEGTLAPGNSIGTVTIAGNLTFGSGSVYAVELSSTASDFTRVTGTAALAGTVAITLLPGETAARHYTILTAAGGLTGSFSGMSSAGLPPWYKAVVGIVGNDVVLDIELALAGLAGLNENQRQVGRTLDRAYNTGPGLGGLFATVLGAPSIPYALTQLSGEIATGAATAGFRQTDQFLELMLDPFAGSRAAGGPAHGGPALAYASAPPAGAARGAGAAAIDRAVKAPLVPDVGPRWRLWAGAFGADATHGGRAAIGSHDLGARNWGLASGADYRVSPDAVLGVALAGGETSFSLGGLGSGRADTLQLGGYGSWRAGPAYVSGAVSYGWHDVRTDRLVALPGVADRLLGDYSGHAVGGRVEAGWRTVATSGIGITPFAAMRVQAFHTPSYAEADASGLAGFALRYAETTATATRSELGARFDAAAWRSADAALTVRGRLAWAHEFTTERALDASFVNLAGSGFTVFGATLPGDSALVSAGAELKVFRGVTLRGSFDGQFAAGTQIYGGMGSVAVVW
ncbi:autotransporter outer membrane beta-barrel domain-containing protein [Rhodoplanes azumiensis]|uniref:Autotransporter domain-containing protein n=1 Tax=Rhodoplanes azumiensis TaxID=1897628 RepID=A0ABW5AMG9_9BRAD